MTSELINILKTTSKHSHYQKLAGSLEKIIPDEALEIKTRQEEERLNYILNSLNFINASIIDIGANTGFFSLETLEKGASNALLVEGNKAHSDFLKKALTILGFKDKSDVINTYIHFKDDKELPKADIIFLLNVLHHIGDDFGDCKITKKEAKNKILLSLEYLSRKTRYLVFQLGFNWKGDVKKPLFKNGTKEEMISFITKGVESSWEVKSIGIAEKTNNKYIYKNINTNNIKRDDSLGEFLNRPLFILKSKNII